MFITYSCQKLYKIMGHSFWVHKCGQSMRRSFVSGEWSNWIISSSPYRWDINMNFLYVDWTLIWILRAQQDEKKSSSFFWIDTQYRSSSQKIWPNREFVRGFCEVVLVHAFMQNENKWMAGKHWQMVQPNPEFIKYLRWPYNDNKCLFILRTVAIWYGWVSCEYDQTPLDICIKSFILANSCPANIVRDFRFIMLETYDCNGSGSDFDISFISWMLLFKS